MKTEVARDTWSSINADYAIGYVNGVPAKWVVGREEEWEKCLDGEEFEADEGMWEIVRGEWKEMEEE